MVKMTSSDPKDVLLLYIAASYSAVSAALVLERKVEGKKKQLPVYFVSEALAASKLMYYELEKIACAVVLTLLRAPIYVPQAHSSCSFSLRVFPQGLSIHGTNILLCLTKH